MLCVCRALCSSTSGSRFGSKVRPESGAGVAASTSSPISVAFRSSRPAEALSVAYPRQWLCFIRFGHKWRRSVNEGMAFQRCVRCGKEREMPVAVPYSGPPV
jgi:hypothetical protein